MNDKSIVLTGGGTAGHVTPNIALLPSLREAGFDINYIGSYKGIEKQLMEAEGIKYYGISSGKLRRYMSLQNLTDPARIFHGIGQARRLLKKLKPTLVFSKGGFVSVPVVIAAEKLNIPVIIHESDMTPGLANKIAMRFASKICCNFPETIKYLPEGKAVLSGSPIRQELFTGSREKGFKFCKFTEDLPVILVVGGSTGALKLNEAIKEILPVLVDNFNVVHLCGKGKADESLNSNKNYIQFEYVNEEMKDLLALSDIVISRAGANAICELLALNKPNILIPLSANASRGDQILNAKSFKEHNYSMVLDEDTMTSKELLSTINELYANRNLYSEAMSKSPQSNAIEIISNLIKEIC